MKNIARAAILSVFAILPSSLLANSVLSVTTSDGSGGTVLVEYSAEDLLELESVEVRTGNDYLDEVRTFTGPRLRSILANSALSTNDSIRVTALNDYSTEIPVSDILDYDVIVAVLMDGEPMSVRDKGPFWVIYPMNEHPELREPLYNDRLIWQLSKVEYLPSP